MYGRISFLYVKIKEGGIGCGDMMMSCDQDKGVSFYPKNLLFKM